MRPALLIAVVLLGFWPRLPAADPPANIASLVELGPLPARVHVFEDYETVSGAWTAAEAGFGQIPPGAVADEILFRAAGEAKLSLDDVLLYEPGATEPYWAERARQVRARFQGIPGTLAHFGDSITVTLAYWSPLDSTPKGMDEATTRAYGRVKAWLKPELWRGWKGPQFGSEGRMTIDWALENVDQWLETMNPEVATLMFGSNDVDQMDAGAYAAKMREVIRLCLDHGTIVVLSTMPPRAGQLAKCRQFAEVTRQIAREERVMLIDYFGEILKRRPEDWDGSLPRFKSSPGDEYQVPTLIARDGVHPSNPRAWLNDFSEEGLQRNGYTLRNYLTLRACAELIEMAGLSRR